LTCRANGISKCLILFFGHIEPPQLPSNFGFTELYSRCE
jgi:hypothetical protein